MYFLRALRKYIRDHGSDNIIYFDESGFVKHSSRLYGWAKRGDIIHDKVPGNNYQRTNLIMAQRKNKWLAPMLFKGGCHKELINT